MKNLLIATDCFLPRWDGIARFLDLFIESVKSKFNVTVIAPDFIGQKKAIKGVRVVRIKTYNFQVGDYSPPKLKIKTIKEEVKKNDIIFSQTMGPIGAVSMLQGKRFKKKVISYIHSLEWELFSKSIRGTPGIRKSVHKITKNFVRTLYNKADLLLVPSRSLALLLRKMNISTPSKILALGVDTTIFKPRAKKSAKVDIGVDPSKILVGYAGRIGREKDITTIINAFKLIKEERNDIQFIIVGSGIKIFDDDIKKNGIKRVGSTNTMWKYLQAMDLYVLASHTETSSLSTMEAMSCGTPPIASGAGETKRYIHEGKNGFLFKQGRHDLLAKKIIMALENPDIRQIGRNARKTIVDNYSWKETVGNISEIFSSV